jgi:paraquat-inducible protein B
MKKYNVPKVKESKSVQILTTIWLVPFLAMIIALWLAFQYYTKLGPTIQISFESNAGLVANQSQIKLRDVTIGMVTKISLAKDGEGVIVEARMNKEVEPYLNDKAKLWIVHADVGSHGVSGLDTLVSGSYIELYGVKEEETKKKFEGIEKPFIDQTAKGEYYLLAAPNSYNITEGSNVYYRMVKVGRVERVGIAPNGKQINFTIFVKNEYSNYVNKRSQFYASSTVGIDFSQGKLDISIASISQIVHGGVSIYTPVQSIQTEQNRSIAQKKVFPLYKNLSEMKEKHLMTGVDNKIYKFNFHNSITKLEIGSPIEFNGFQVGYVTDIESNFDENNKSIKSDVFAIIHTKAFTGINSDKEGSQMIEELVNNGLKAQLNSNIPMVGSKFIDLIFKKDKNSQLLVDNNYTLFPTIETQEGTSIIDEVKNVIVKIEKLELEKLLASATKLLDQNQKPVNDLLKDLRKTINHFDKSVQNLNIMTEQDALQQLPNDIQNTLSQLTVTLEEIEKLSTDYNADSIFASELSITLKELTATAESMGIISHKLERRTNALLLGDD